jgi:hypothetical protein
MQEHTFKPGDKSFTASDATGQSNRVVFEDDGDCGYFYACDAGRDEGMILDAVYIYSAANVVDRERDSTLSIVWSEDESKCALLINGYPHAAFDFIAKRGYARTNFPNFEEQISGCWQSQDHSWSEEAISWLYL